MYLVVTMPDVYLLISGAFFTMTSLPVLVYYLYFACNNKSCSLTFKPTFSTRLDDYIDPQVILIYMGWIVFQAVLYMLPFGKVKTKTELSRTWSLYFRPKKCLRFLVIGRHQNQWRAIKYFTTDMYRRLYVPSCPQVHVCTIQFTLPKLNHGELVKPPSSMVKT